MRRTILFAVVLALVLSFVALPAAARPTGGPTFRVSCDWGIDLVQPVRGGSVGWYSGDPAGGTAPYLRLVWGVWDSPELAPAVEDSQFLTAMDTNFDLSLCFAQGPLDPFPGVDYVEFYAYFVRMPYIP